MPETETEQPDTGPEAPAEEPQGRRIDLAKLNGRLRRRIGDLVQDNEALQMVVEEQEEEMAALRGELVAATTTPAGAKPAKR